MKMKILNKKGFFMTETLVVIVFVAAIFTFLYISILPLVGTYNDKTTRESDIDIVYKLYHIRKMIYEDSNRENITGDDFKEIKCTDLNNTESCNTLMNYLELNNYTLLYVDGINDNINKLNVSQYNEIYKTLANKLNEEEANDTVLILYDNEKNTSARLKYDDSIHGSIAYKLVEKEINKHNKDSCLNKIIYEEDGIKYFSGTNTCINFNYVWYSGKLWRITAIYPDGTIKMITENALTNINWGSNIEYNGSWIYQWVNEDFYDTLVNTENIIETTSWNYSTDNNSTPVKPETLSTQKTVSAPVGILSAYEYRNAYRNASTSNNYLNIEYYWWTITPKNSYYNFCVSYRGDWTENAEPTLRYGVRPVIKIKSSVRFIGSGTKTNPYRIIDDKESPTNNELISSRSIGEYVKFDNDIYRIVSINESLGTTKLVKTDYIRDNGNVVNKRFASTIYFGKSDNTKSIIYWDYYLNNSWYNSISTTYKNMLVNDTYYLGGYGSQLNYKTTMCSDSSLNSVTTKNCTKYTSSIKKFVGKVGLLRVGEMFSSQLAGGKSTSKEMSLITPLYNSTTTGNVYEVSQYGALSHIVVGSSTVAVRPTITLKNGIKITGGTGYVGGSTNSPFEISE